LYFGFVENAMIRKIIRKRPHHLPRECYRGYISVGFTASVREHTPLFTADKSVADFVDILDWARKRNGCVVLLYCFMPDHLHLVVHGTSEHADLFKMMVDFKQKSGFFLRSNRSNCRWQKDFYDSVLRTDQQLAKYSRYVAENPVRRGLVAYWQDYPYTDALGVSLQYVVDIMSER
jgi:putative transposase